MRLNQFVLATMAAFVVIAAAALLTASAAPSNADQDNEIIASQQQAGVRANFTLPALFDFDNYKRLFEKRYTSLTENMVRFKLFTSRAMRAVVSGIKYRFRQARYHFAVNHMSDASPEELDRMRNRVLEADNLNRTQVSQSSSSEQAGLPEFIPDDDENVLEILRQTIDAHRGEPGFDELRAQLGEVEQARSQSKRRKRDTSESADTAEETPRELPLEKLISLPVSESDLVSAETRAKIRTHPAGNNPEYRGHEPMTQGLVDQQVAIPRLALGTRKALLDDITRSLSGLRLKYLLGGANQAKLPDEVFLDLREKSNCFFPPRSQGACGSCYAFAGIAVAEWLHCKTTGELVPFSEQYVMDCGKTYAKDDIYGCNGGFVDRLSKFFHNFGFELRTSYPYQRREQECPYQAETDLASVGYIRGDMRKSIVFYMGMWPEALERHGPLAININTDRNFQEYGGGVYDDCKPNDGDHSVVLIGHGREDGEEYWLIRNSYSARWGDKGYLKLSKKADCVSPRFGYTFGSDDGQELTMKTIVNKANDGSAVKAKYNPNQRFKDLLLY